MTVILSGGGSGGHITPILAVASAIKKLDKNIKVIYIGQTGDNFGDLARNNPSVDEVYTVRAGKYRRYHGEGWKQLLDVPTIALNCRDFVYLNIGIIQSIKLIKRLKPDVLFTRGGFVSVPTALGAKFNGVPYITHDSDSLPSLANKIISRWAAKHFVAMDESLYPYPKNKTIKTGIPLSSKFVSVDQKQMQSYREKLGLPLSAKVLFVIGGGLGSQIINTAITDVAPVLLSDNKDLYLIHITGKQNEDDVKADYLKNVEKEDRDRVKTFGYIDNVFEYSGAADVVVTRAGATNIAEFALQGKACIIIPSNFLTGGHQLKNADVLKRSEAAIVIDEDSLINSEGKLEKNIDMLLKDDQKRSQLAANIKKYAMPDATETIAKLVVEEGQKAK